MSNFEWANEASRDFLSKGYLQDGMTIEERTRDIADAVAIYASSSSEFTWKEIYDKVYNYIAAGYYSISSPVMSNFGNNLGLPISCNNVTIDDSMESIIKKQAEVGRQTQYGAGTSGYFGKIRPRGAPVQNSKDFKADGPVHYMSLFEAMTDVVSQGSVRRGNFAAYLDVDHPDIMEFLEAREGEHFIQKLSLGVCISDDFMLRCMQLDPKANKIMARILKKREETGYPYIFFTDTVNRNKPSHYKDRTILSSNLCSEIAQPSDTNESFVCCLMSMNLAKYDEWKNTDAVFIALLVMDAVLQDYIDKIKDDDLMRTSYNSASRYRAVGVGTLGYHTMLQQKSIAFESIEARELNKEVHKFIWDELDKATQRLAIIFGEPEGLKGTGRRNGTLTAIAPTTSSSFILGQVSPSIEPLAGNIMTKDLSKGKYLWKNPELAKVLQKYGKDTDEVWANISDNYGSVQHLDFLSAHEKNVFKTFYEISQFEIIGQASDRQKFLDQSQSVNLTFPADTPPEVLNRAIFEAWSLELKTLYYQRPFKNRSQQLSKEILSTCIACEA